MNLKQFKYVLTLAETKSFSKAAEILNVSQPSLSQYIKYLEKEIGVELFDRSGLELKITDAGQEYINVGRKIIVLEHQLQSKFSDIKKCDFGTISIGTSLYRGTCVMPCIIANFNKKYPGIKIIIEEKLEKGLIEDAILGEFDMFITNGPINDKRFLSTFIWNEEFILIAPKNNKFYSNNGLIDIKELNNKNFVVLENNQLIQSQLNYFCSEYDIKINMVCECRNIVTQLALVNEGLGCALVPSTAIDFSLTASNVTFYKFIQSMPKRNVYVAYLKDHYLSEAAKYLIELLIQFKKGV